MYTNMVEVKIDVEANGGLLTVTMGALRTAYGVDKLGVHVRKGIGKALNGVGLAHTPDDLPNYQENLVRVYKQGTPAAELIRAATTPSKDLDEVLRQAVGGEASETLARIRELVCE